jgi:tripartite ATP-independent transporter DctM subunit
MFKLLGSLLSVLAVGGMPLFAVLGAISFLCWMASDKAEHRFFRHVAANVLEEKFADSVILATIPLFVFCGYLLAESNTPKRIVKAASAALGWLPGGIAIVCIFATAMFTMLTGGSGVAIVAIGGLLFPVLLEQGYSKNFSLGLVTSAGAVGLLIPPSPLVLIYCYVTGVPEKRAYLATLPPGLVLMLLLAIYAMYVGWREKIPTQKFELKAMLREVWGVKWEMLAPVLVIVGLGSSLMQLHESAAACALYCLIVEKYIYKDVTWKQVRRVAREAIALSGAIIVILAMAAALTNYVLHAEIPKRMLDWFASVGMKETWHFIVVLNVFLFILGMLLDGFSVLLVGLPMLVPMAAAFGVHPFHLAVMFLLNLEIAYISPPVGLNLYISAFRFRRPVVEIYRVVLPFLAILTAGLVFVIVYKPLSTFTVNSDVTALRCKAAFGNVPEKERQPKIAECIKAGGPTEAQAFAGNPPTEAWAIDCIQEDRNNVLPCGSDKEKCDPNDSKKCTPTWVRDGGIWKPYAVVAAAKGNEKGPDKDDDKDDDDTSDFDEADDKGKTKGAKSSPSASAAPSASSSAKPKKDDDDDEDL